MFRKDCKLARAAMYFMGGGGGGSDINQMPGGFRNWQTEQKDIKKGYAFQEGEFGSFRDADKLLGPATTGALDFWKQLPDMLSQFKGFGNELSADQSQIRGFQGQLGGLNDKLAAQADTLGGLISSPFGPAAITATGGALTQQMARDVDQTTLGLESRAGTARDVGAIGRNVLNRDAARQARYNTALQQEQGLLGQQQGVYGAQAGVTGQQAGLTQMLAGLTGQKAGLLGQQQALQTGGLNQLLGVGNAAVSQFGGLTNPILAYIQGIFGGNQQAAIQQAAINAQQNAAGSSATGGLISGIGSIIGGVAMAY